MNNLENIEILEKKSLPKALDSLIDKSNTILQETQRRLVEEIKTASLEIMNIMDLKHEDGWRIDLGNKIFIKIKIDENS